MGIFIDDYFFDMNAYKKILNDIIFYNFFYYRIIYEMDSLEIIEERCRFLLYRRTHIKLDDYTWKTLWENMITSIRMNDRNFIFL